MGVGKKGGRGRKGKEVSNGRGGTRKRYNREERTRGCKQCRRIREGEGRVG